MRKRLLKPLVYLVVAAQLLLAVPALAFAGTASGAMAAADAGDHCPCCPDGADSMKDCLASCTLAAAAVPVASVSGRIPAPSLRVEAQPSVPLSSLSDPPLTPPPIR